jgi:DNA-binding protein YbaB
MEDLIKALTILKKYITEDYLLNYPTNCDHDILRVSVDPAVVSEEDMQELENLSFHPDEEYSCFSSFRFGSN